MRSRTLPIVIALATPVLLAVCGHVGPTAPGDDSGAPPSQSEGPTIIETSRGRAAAELVAEPSEIAPGSRVILRVENRGEVGLAYGRPILVEQWDGGEWVETDESRQTAWTLELILVRPQQSGVEQRWPFVASYTPRPGWYRFTKQIQTEDTNREPERFVVRARVRVLER
jgi:hypothetical protein